MNYLQIIVYVTLQFIMGQAVESVNAKLFEESQTVNASACEFMELVLKSLEQHKKESADISHLIIRPILKTFRQNIENKNNAMQVNMLNLLKVLLFQSNFLEQAKEKQYVALYKSSYLIDSLVLGMKNEVSFVRMHFIQFVCELIQPMNQILQKQQEFANHMKSLMECFCELLKKVDVTIYSTQSEQ